MNAFFQIHSSSFRERWKEVEKYQWPAKKAKVNVNRLLFINIITSVEKSGNFSLSDEWQPKFPEDFASWGKCLWGH